MKLLASAEHVARRLRLPLAVASDITQLRAALGAEADTALEWWCDNSGEWRGLCGEGMAAAAVEAAARAQPPLLKLRRAS